MLTTPVSMAVSVWRWPSGTTNPTPTESACVSGTTGAVIVNAVSYLHLLGSRVRGQRVAKVIVKEPGVRVTGKESKIRVQGQT